MIGSDRGGGRRIRAWTMLTLRVLGVGLAAGCARTPPPDPPRDPLRDGSAFVFECAESDPAFEFVLHVAPERVSLWLPPRFARPYLTLDPVPAASGAKYEADGVVVWTHGTEARLEVDGTAFPACRENRSRSLWEDAKLRGVDFRGLGNEPGWVLEIRNGDRMDLSTDYGERHLTAPAPDVEDDPAAGRTIYRARSGDVVWTVTLEAGGCTDDMSGEPFETRVTVELEDRVLRGCGRPLH